jgi:uncharacterized protein (TIGR03546 family)
MILPEVIMVVLIARLLASLASYGRPRQIAFGIATGAALALIPSSNLLWILLFTLFFFIRLNQAAFLGALGLVRLFVPLVDPILERWGYSILTARFLSEPLGRFLSLPLAGWTRLDDSLVAGSLVAAVVSWIPLFLVGYLLVVIWRRYLSDPIRRVFRNWGKKIPWLGKIITAFTRTRTIFRAGGVA